MRTHFASLAFPLEAADRLAALLPALTLDRARDWTAQVYGYSNWAQLTFEVENAPEPGGPGLSPDLKYALDTYYAGRASQEDMQRHEQQIRKLNELLGWSERAAEHLYVVWEPRRGGCPQELHLANVGMGSPAFQLMQRNIFVPVTEPGPVSASHAGYIFEGFQGPAEKLHSAAEAFLATLPEDLPAAERRDLAADLMSAPQTIPGIGRLAEPDTFVQVLPMTFFAHPDLDDPEIIGVASMTFALIASRDGSHSIKIKVERVVPTDDIDLVLTFADAMAVATWEAVTRYLWTTVGNSNDTATVQVEYRAEVPAEKECASDILKLIDAYCARHEVDTSPGKCGIKFELVPLSE